MFVNISGIICYWLQYSFAY